MINLRVGILDLWSCRTVLIWCNFYGGLLAKSWDFSLIGTHFWFKKRDLLKLVGQFSFFGVKFWFDLIRFFLKTRYFFLNLGYFRLDFSYILFNTFWQIWFCLLDTWFSRLFVNFPLHSVDLNISFLDSIKYLITFELRCWFRNWWSFNWACTWGSLMDLSQDLRFDILMLWIDWSEFFSLLLENFEILFLGWNWVVGFFTFEDFSVLGKFGF